MKMRDKPWDPTLDGVCAWAAPYFAVCSGPGIRRYYPDGSTNKKGQTWRVRLMAHNGKSAGIKPQWLLDPARLFRLYRRVESDCADSLVARTKEAKRILAYFQETYGHQGTRRIQVDEATYVEIDVPSENPVAVIRGQVPGERNSDLEELADVLDRAAVADFVAMHDRYSRTLLKRYLFVLKLLLNVARRGIRHAIDVPKKGIILVRLQDHVLLFAPGTHKRAQPEYLTMYHVDDENKYLVKVDLA